MSDMPEDAPYDDATTVSRPGRPDALTVFEHAAGAKHIGQGTAVEQARAVAEVRAAVLIAMERPRNVTAAISEMRAVCQIAELADRAFFSVKRGSQAVNGASIHLARELARCWGNVNYGVKELVRDDVRHQSELLAFAWDLQTNARSEVTFVIPHERHTKSGPRALTGTQEIYENNASFAGRRLREVIFAVLPVWFKAEAEAICRRTLEHGGGKPIETRRADCVGLFEAMGIPRATLEQKIGRPAGEWLAEDIANLGITYKSLKRNEITRDEAFPDETVSSKALPQNADSFERAASGKGFPAVSIDSYISDIENAPNEAALLQLQNLPLHRDLIRKASEDDRKRVDVAIKAATMGFEKAA